MTKFLLGAAAAFALFAATPASACDDCKNCDHNKTAQADKKDDKGGCHCKGSADGKCKCGDKCTCDHCKAPKKDEPKKT
jgi:hypothetical protein